MKPTTIRLNEDTIAELDAEAEERGLSRTDYIREVISKRHEYDRLQKEYEQQLADYENQIERLQREKRMIIEDREERTELVRYVEDELSYRQAGLGTRMKWWLFGKSGE